MILNLSLSQTWSVPIIFPLQDAETEKHLNLAFLKSPYHILPNSYCVEKLPCKRYKIYITDAKIF